jgi:hypothetical protein
MQTSASSPAKVGERAGSLCIVDRNALQLLARASTATQLGTLPGLEAVKGMPASSSGSVGVAVGICLVWFRRSELAEKPLGRAFAEGTATSSCGSTEGGRSRGDTVVNFARGVQIADCHGRRGRLREALRQQVCAVPTPCAASREASTFSGPTARGRVAAARRPRRRPSAPRRRAPARGGCCR